MWDNPPPRSIEHALASAPPRLLTAPRNRRALDPERLLWVPGRKHIVALPALTPAEIHRRMLAAAYRGLNTLLDLSQPPKQEYPRWKYHPSEIPRIVPDREA